jgi:ADP-heptose:LPS heptosyltransferase
VVRANPHIDAVIEAPRTRGLKRIAADLAIARDVRRRRFDLVLDLHGGPRSAWFAWASGARERIGYDITGRAWMYTRTVHRPRELRPRHSVQNQWDLLERIPGWPGGAADPERDPVEMPNDAAADARVAAQLRRERVDDDDEIVVVHVSAGNPFRRWPEASFVELVCALASANPKRRLVLSSGPSDHDAADRIAKAARQRLGGNGRRVLDLGELGLPELRAIAARARLFIGGDTGPLHIAATTAVPIVGIYGPTLSQRSAPWRSPSARTLSVELDTLPCRPCDQRTCVPGDFRCLTTLKPEAVIAAAERALS